jgi:hypothetical protein
LAYYVDPLKYEEKGKKKKKNKNKKIRIGKYTKKKKKKKSHQDDIKVTDLVNLTC